MITGRLYVSRKEGRLLSSIVDSVEASIILEDYTKKTKGVLLQKPVISFSTLEQIGIELIWETENGKKRKMYEGFKRQTEEMLCKQTWT